MASGNSFLLNAILKEDGDKTQVLRDMIENGVNVNSSDYNGFTALMCAASDGHVECVSSLLDVGANVNQSDKTGRTALMYVSNGDVECVRLLIEAGASVNKEDGYGYGSTALIKAASNGYDECIRLLLEAGADVNWSNDIKQTALMKAAINGHVQCVRVLLEAGASVDMAHFDCETALMVAASEGRDECVRLLLEAGADVNRSNDRKQTSLIEAASNGHVQCVKILVDACAGVNKSDENGHTALLKAASGGHVEYMELILEAGGNVNHADKKGNTALILCLASYSALKVKACLKLLVNAGSDINARNNKNLQPIHYALKWWKHLNFAAEYLISENCNLSQASYDHVKACVNEDYYFKDSLKLNLDGRLDMLKLLFNCGLPCNLCESFIVEQDAPVKDWIETVASQPKTLKSICVFKIRKNLGLGIKSKVTKLNLPNVIQNLILLKGILSVECFL